MTKWHRHRPVPKDRARFRWKLWATEVPNQSTSLLSPSVVSCFCSVPISSTPYAIRALSATTVDGLSSACVIIFTSNLGLSQPNPAVLTVQAAGFDLLVENVRPITGVVSTLHTSSWDFLIAYRRAICRSQSRSTAIRATSRYSASRHESLSSN